MADFLYANCEDSSLSKAASIISILTFAYGILLGMWIQFGRTNSFVENYPEELKRIRRSLYISFADYEHFERLVYQDALPFFSVDGKDSSILYRARLLSDEARANIFKLKSYIDSQMTSNENGILSGFARHAVNRQDIMEMLDEKDKIMREIQKVKEGIEKQMSDDRLGNAKSDRSKQSELLNQILNEVRRLRPDQGGDPVTMSNDEGRASDWETGAREVLAPTAPLEGAMNFPTTVYRDVAVQTAPYSETWQ